MKTANPTRALTCILVVCFLLSSIISKAFEPLACLSDGKAATEKKVPAPVKPDPSDSQVPDEEEGEEKSEKEFDERHSVSASPDFVLIDPCHAGPARLRASLCDYSLAGISKPGYSGGIFLFIRSFRI